MGLFPLTLDKLGPLICKRIKRLTLFARARWHMEAQPRKQGARTATRMQPISRSFKIACHDGETVWPLQVCRCHICDYDPHEAGTLIGHLDTLSSSRSEKGFGGVIFNGPCASNKDRTCFSRTEQPQRQSLRIHKQQWEGQTIRFLIKNVFEKKIASSLVAVHCFVCVCVFSLSVNSPGIRKVHLWLLLSYLFIKTVC